MKLNIPFLTQMGNTIHNDCGPACLGSVVGVGIEGVINVMNTPANHPYSVQDILSGLRKYGLNGRYTRPVTIPAIHDALANRQPVICLIHYGVLPAELRSTTFRGAHWVTVVGVEETDFFVHDPLHPAHGYQRWPAAELDKALASRNTSNLPRQAVVVLKPYPVVNENAAAHKALAQRASQSARHMRDELTIKSHYLRQIYDALGIAGEGDEAQGHALSAILRLKNEYNTPVDNP